MPRNATWTNSDGLVVGFGKHTSDNNVPAVEGGKGATRVARMVITGANLELTGSLTAASIPPQSIILKRGAQIQRATFVVSAAFSTGSSPTLTIGTYKFDDITTVDDLDGIDATIAAAALDTVGEIVRCDGALVNAAGVTTVGAVSNSDVVIVAQYGTAAFTTGVGILTVEYVEPSYNLSVVN